jgi:hypothetical protein
MVIGKGSDVAGGEGVMRKAAKVEKPMIVANLK